MKGEVYKMVARTAHVSCLQKDMRQILKMLRFLLEVIGMDRIRNECFRGNAGLEMRLAR